MMSDATPADLRIRSATTDDLPRIRQLVSRLTDFGPPRWRDARAIEAASAAMLEDALQAGNDDGRILLAVDRSGEPLGFVQVAMEPEFFTGEPQAYIPNLAVAMAAEGRGVGRALVGAAEDWARARGLRCLTLFVFADNRAARSFYVRLGFREDSLKLVKMLR